MSRFGTFPVHRGRLDREALRQAEHTLSKGRVLVMFPQGARKGSAGYVQEGFLGAALIATRSNVPVLPIGITGTEVMKGWSWMLRRPRITVNIGTPFQLAAAGGRNRRTFLEEETQTIMQHIDELLPAEYRAKTQEGTDEARR